jgi:hypothetical protein
MPFDVFMEGARMSIRVHGTVTAQDLVDLVEQVAALESAQPTAPDRIVDVTQAEATNAGFPEVLALAQRRRTAELRNPVRSAVVTGNDAQYGMARMYQTLSDHPQVTLRIFKSLSEATDWLDS